MRAIIDGENKLNDSNFSTWYRNLKIVLRYEKLLYTIEEACLKEPGVDATDDELDTYARWRDDSEKAVCIMLASMSPQLQEQHEKMDAKSIILHLEELYKQNARNERYEVSKKLFRTRMAEGTQVGPHVLKMIGYIEKLATLGFMMDFELSIDLILQSLPDSFSQFVMNFNMNNMERTLSQLMNMLKTAEADMKKSKPVLLVGAGGAKGKGKGKAKAKPKPKPKGKTFDPSKLQSSGGVNKDGKAVCFYCGKSGHFRKHCKAFLASKKKRLDASTSGTPVATSGMYMIEINYSPGTS